MSVAGVEAGAKMLGVAWGPSASARLGSNRNEIVAIAAPIADLGSDRNHSRFIIVLSREQRSNVLGE